MRILVCASYTPYPPTGGGRADIWRRILAFTKLGHSVALVNQYDPAGPIPSTPQHRAEMDEVLQARYSYPLETGLARNIRQIAQLPRLPWRTAKTLPADVDWQSITSMVHDFAPDLVWLDGPWVGAIGSELAAEHGVPIAYRSHNVEHVYLRRQAKASPVLRNRITWRLSALGLKRYELQLMKAASRVLDISLDDLEFWRNEGVADARWLPPLPELALSGPPEHTIPGDVVFAGGLRVPNNVDGVRWLVTMVLPILRANRPELTVSVVGSNPLPDLAAELAANPAVRTFYDVPSVNPYLFGAKVLVNPVGTGSGVHLKMLDMLMTDAPIVTRNQGARGFPPECVAEFDVASTAEDFAAAILRRLDRPGIDPAKRERSRAFFTISAVREAIAGLATPD